ncbi:MFS transporter [Bailinhaonella thermotolerans]|uniref:MFS transporter n=1 Tax=Bailinhaonella thermotolerans TaxID=1070861 RepID=A0A3A4AYG3_9ACTN|nr:MFS transporter [Bailinhaonella thermotolerans]RJL30907.1 MFS transporter [Bailinhaonella thermotolerans]
MLLKGVEGRDFGSLWAAQSISQVGSQITTVALPLAAVALFDVGPAQMGLLNAAVYLPALLLTLLAGVWIDRSRRRPLLIGADLGRAVAIGLIPATALAGLLGVEGLYLLVLVSGALTVLFDTAYHAYVPTLVPGGGLVRANSRLQFSVSLAQMAGPGLGGLLIQGVGAPVVLAVAAASFLLSALFLARVRHRERRPERAAGRRIRQEIAEGLRATFGNRHVRPVVLEAATFNFFFQFIASLYILYAVHDLGLSAGVIGAVATAGAAGAMLGALVTERLVRRMGFGPALITTMVIASTPLVAIPLATGPASPFVLAGAYFTQGIGLAVSASQAVTLRQVAVPPAVVGRANAAYRTLSFGVLPLGALTGGLLGDLIGLRAALVVGGVGLALAPAWVLLSPVRHLRTAEEARPGEPGAAVPPPAPAHAP